MNTEENAISQEQLAEEQAAARRAARQENRGAYFVLVRTVQGYALRAEVRLLDDGVHVLFTGGSRTHVGAVSMAEWRPGGAPAVQTLQRENHRDAAVSEAWAGALCAALRAPACVCAGIHYENADRARIEEILRFSAELLREAQQLLQREPAEQ